VHGIGKEGGLLFHVEGRRGEHAGDWLGSIRLIRFLRSECPVLSLKIVDCSIRFKLLLNLWGLVLTYDKRVFCLWPPWPICSASPLYSWIL
jgi:hypothetical protein